MRCPSTLAAVFLIVAALELPARAPEWDKPGWQLTFQDEFDGSAVGATKWVKRYKWGEAQINSELEAYVDDAFQLQGGVLTIVGDKRTATYAGQIIWTIDGVERKRHTGDGIPQVPMYVILNLAIGSGWPGAPDATTPFPAGYQIDYVRTYAPLPDGGPGTGGSGTPAGARQAAAAPPAATRRAERARAGRARRARAEPAERARVGRAPRARAGPPRRARAGPPRQAATLPAR